MATNNQENWEQKRLKKPGDKKRPKPGQSNPSGPKRKQPPKGPPTDSPERKRGPK